MSNDFLIKKIKEKMHDLEKDINNFSKIIEQGAGDIAISYKNKVKELKHEKDLLLEKLKKFEAGDENVIDDIKVFYDMLESKIEKKWDEMKIEHKIKEADSSTFNDILKKHHKNHSDFSIDIEINKLLSDEKNLVATRSITINCTPSNAKKIYTTSDADQLWHVTFEKDLQQGFFDN